MEEKIEYDDAKKAKEVLIKWLEQELDMDYVELYDSNTFREKILYLALRQDMCII